MNVFQLARRQTPRQRLGFTVLEVLIALTASLLMMLALTRAFKMIGDKISLSQSELELSGTLRNITFAMRDELDRMTAEMVAPQPRDAASGYFTYYEGPWTDGTTQLINNVGPQAGYLPTSRYGDLDDYVAFTARAKADAPFVGLIPRGVLEAHRFEAASIGGEWQPGTFVTADGISIGNYTLAMLSSSSRFTLTMPRSPISVLPIGREIRLASRRTTAMGIRIFVDVVNEVGRRRTVRWHSGPFVAASPNPVDSSRPEHDSASNVRGNQCHAACDWTRMKILVSCRCWCRRLVQRRL